jgi:hypothetical protein
MAIEVQKVKIFSNVATALLNCAMINARRIGREDYINTWEPLFLKGQGATDRDSKRMSRSSISYMQTQYQNPINEYDYYRSLNNLSSAVANINAALFNMSETFRDWLAAEEYLS